MAESKQIREILEEHSVYLRLESDRISTLIGRVQQLEEIVRKLAETVEIYGNVLPNVQSGYPYWSHESWKKSLNRYAKLNEELAGFVKRLSS